MRKVEIQSIVCASKSMSPKLTSLFLRLSPRSPSFSSFLLSQLFSRVQCTLELPPLCEPSFNFEFSLPFLLLPDLRLLFLILEYLLWDRTEKRLQVRKKKVLWFGKLRPLLCHFPCPPLPQPRDQERPEFCEWSSKGAAGAGEAPPPSLKRPIS